MQITERVVVLGLLLIGINGCTPRVEVAVPNEPITINLNVKIDHEVRVKVEKDLDKVLSPDSDLFQEDMKIQLQQLSSRVFLLILLFVVGLLFSANASALTLDQAKATGLVGERMDGYLGVVSSTPEVEQLVKQKNAERQIAYQAIAKKNGTDLKTVELLAGQKAIENTVPGQWVQLPSGKWSRK